MIWLQKQTGCLRNQVSQQLKNQMQIWLQSWCVFNSKFQCFILELDILTYLSHDLFKNEFFAMYNTEKLAWTSNHVGVVSKVNLQLWIQSLCGTPHSWPYTKLRLENIWMSQYVRQINLTGHYYSSKSDSHWGLPFVALCQTKVSLLEN